MPPHEHIARVFGETEYPDCIRTFLYVLLQSDQVDGSRHSACFVLISRELQFSQSVANELLHGRIRNIFEGGHETVEGIIEFGPRRKEELVVN